MKRKGKYIIFFAFIGQLTQAAHFGFCLRPSSGLQLVLDLFFFGCFVLGIYLIRKPKAA